jgi:hypothetical protein
MYWAIHSCWHVLAALGISLILLSRRRAPFAHFAALDSKIDSAPTDYVKQRDYVDVTLKQLLSLDIARNANLTLRVPINKVPNIQPMWVASAA